MIHVLYSDFDNTLLKTEGGVAFYRGLLYALSPDPREVTDARHDRLVVLLGKVLSGDNSLLAELSSEYSQGIRGNTLKDIRNYVGEYLGDIGGVDHRTLGAIRSLRHDRGVTTGIITRNCDVVVHEILRILGYDDVFYELIANRFDSGEDGPVFDWRISNKKEILAERLEEKRIRPEHAAYIGDDLSDEDSLALVGYPVISRFAEDVFKSEWRRRGALVLGDPGSELERYLISE
jgi:phosphoserine phosphatase